MFTLVLGGRRSGKSLWAENEALAVASSMHAGSGKLLYIATAPPAFTRRCGNAKANKRA